MGNPMARHVRKAGFELTVCDRNAAVRNEFAALGARVTARSADCADCDVVIMLVATPEQLSDALLGADGLKANLREGLPPLIVVMSTVAPDDMHSLENAFQGTGVRLVDAPVSGGVVGARRGTLTVLVGGKPEDLEDLRPVFAPIGEKIIHCGTLGAGQATKAINNVIAIANLLISAEAYAIALSNGLDLEKLIPALEAGSARNFMSKNSGDPPEVFGAWSETKAQYEAVMNINRKDIDLALAMNVEGLELPAIRALRSLLDRAGGETLANWRIVAGATSGKN